jgi:hypothetical protein
MQREDIMLNRSSTVAMALVAALALCAASARAHDESKYPDLSGQWRKPVGVGNQWDPTKRPGPAQEAPLTPEYQAALRASLADQAAGGQGEDARYTCITNGMPRIMTAVRPIEFVITPPVTFIIFEAYMPRRIFTDGRDFPKNEEPSYIGYSIGKWIDEDKDGRYDVLEVETRNFKGPRTFEATGLMMHKDNETIVKEKIYLDKANKDHLKNEITVIDKALTRPWTVTKTYHRFRDNITWFEDNCNENNQHVVIGKDNYFLSADGYLMPARKDQKPPDLRYFKQTAK